MTFDNDSNFKALVKAHAEAWKAVDGLNFEQRCNSISCVFDLMLDLLAKRETGKSFHIPHFGSLKWVDRAEKKGHNPKTGESIMIPACTKIKFTPSSDFKGIRA